jgi:hypothetical protein
MPGAKVSVNPLELPLPKAELETTGGEAYPPDEVGDDVGTASVPEYSDDATLDITGPVRLEAVGKEVGVTPVMLPVLLELGFGVL